MRARRVTTALVLALSGALLTGGCEAAVGGVAGISAEQQHKVDARAAERAAAEAAIAALETAPAIAVKATLKDASGNPAEQQLRVTRQGSALGSLPVDGQAVQVLAADNQVYIAANPDYWKAHGLDDGAQFGTGWVRTAGTELPLDPAGKLAPAKLAAGLRKAVAASNPLADPVTTKLPDGTEAYQLGTAPSTLVVTKAKPNRVVSFAPAMLDPQAGPHAGAEFRVEPLAGDALKTFHTDLVNGVGALGQPFDGLAQASVVVLTDKLDCKNYVGTCTTTADVSNTVVGAAGAAVTVHVTLNIEATADALGSQTCSAQGDAAANATITLSCDVKFNLPNRTASYQVLSKPSATGEVRASLDANAVKQKLDTEFASLGG